MWVGIVRNSTISFVYASIYVERVLIAEELGPIAPEHIQRAVVVVYDRQWRFGKTYGLMTTNLTVSETTR